MGARASTFGLAERWQIKNIMLLSPIHNTRSTDNPDLIHGSGVHGWFRSRFTSWTCNSGDPWRLEVNTEKRKTVAQWY